VPATVAGAIPWSLTSWEVSQDTGWKTVEIPPLSVQL
jgi:hypothetical protein